jgi:hypothetical protein
MLRGEKTESRGDKTESLGFFVIHSVGRGDKTESLGDKTESLGDKPSTRWDAVIFLFTRWDAARRGEKSFVR